MGNESSKSNYATPGGRTEQGVRVGAHSGVPNDPVPYAGSPLQYCFVNVEASLKAKATFFSAPIVTTNIDAYYGLISQPYAQGFVMNQFQAIPGVQRQKGFSPKVGMPFQAILSRPVSAPTQEQWQLRVEKSFLQTQIDMKFFTSMSQVMSDTSDIYQKINAVSAQGGRLICVEITGYQKGHTYGQSNSAFQGVKGVDLFFNMPLHPNPQIYVYQAVSVPVKFKVKSFGQPHVQVLTDFMGQFAAFLQKGWKLVEINFDCSLTTQPGFFTAHASMNSIWFFEKEASKMNSEVPEWEGTIVEYEHRIAGEWGGGGTRAKTNWDPLIIEMGQRGWELACLVESPEMYTTGFATAAIKVIMFFQRRILEPVGASGFAMPPQGSYSPPQGSKPLPPYPGK